MTLRTACFSMFLAFVAYSQDPLDTAIRETRAALESTKKAADAELAARRGRIESLRRELLAEGPPIDAIEQECARLAAEAEVGAIRLPSEELAANAEDAQVREAEATWARFGAIEDLVEAHSRAAVVRVEGRLLHIGTLLTVESLDGDRALLRYPGRRDPVGPIVIPGLSVLMAGGADGLRSGALTFVPVEVTGRLKVAEVRARRDLWGWIDAGGPIVIIILILGGIAVIVALLRFAQISVTRPVPDAAISRSEAHVSRGDAAAALAELRQSGAEGVEMARALEGVVDASGEQRRMRMDAALDAAASRHERRATFIAAVAGLTPLLGLLGTVMGMITTFEGVGGSGPDRSELLSRGISEALITTEAGLMFAIPLLLLHALVLSRAETLTAAFEDGLASLVPAEAQGP